MYKMKSYVLNISDYFSEMFEKFKEVDYKSWILFGAILALGIIIFIIARSNGKGKKLTTEGIVIGAVCIALSFILCNIRLFRMPNGGSVTPASSLPIFLYAYAFGPVPGLQHFKYLQRSLYTASRAIAAGLSAALYPYGAGWYLPL